LVIKNNVYSKRSGYYAWPQFRILGAMAVVYGIYRLFSEGFTLFGVEIALILAGIAANIPTTGIQVNFKNKTYREYVSLLGLRSGKWVKLPDIDYVTVHNEQIVKQGGVQSISYKDRYKILRIRLIVSEKQHYDVGVFDKKEEAIKTGKLCAEKLNIRLLDYTEHEPRWVDLNNPELS